VRAPSNYQTTHTLILPKDIQDVGQQLIEDNIVSVSRQMIDKEASVPKPSAAPPAEDSDEMVD
jgi:26S proteasome regulatory subunit N11